MREEKLEIGDRLALFTEGVTEAMDAEGQFLGNEGLLPLLEEHAREPVDELCELIIREVVEFQGHNQQDDATFLLIQRNS